MSEDKSLEDKLDKIFEKLDKRLQSIESKMDERLSKVENKCTIIEHENKKLKLSQEKINAELENLKVCVHTLEQQRLENNIIIKGIPEDENEDAEDLSFKVDQVFCHLNKEFESHQVTHTRRIGNKSTNNKSRLVIAKIVSSAHKETLMKGLASKDINCSQFKKSHDNLWGAAEEKIYLSDHLTPIMSSIFYQARLLKKKKIIKYAWTKLGNIYVKKDDNDRAFNIKSMQQLSDFKRKYIFGKNEETEIELSDESAADNEMDTESEAASKKSNDSKRRRSPIPTTQKATRRSPQSKRLKQKNK